MAPIIGLQAVTHALGDLARVPAVDRPLALDRAELLIREHAEELLRSWGREALPTGLLDLFDDANAALANARRLYAGSSDGAGAAT